MDYEVLDWLHEGFGAGAATLKSLQHDVMHQLRGSRLLRSALTAKEELVAHLRWSTRLLQADTRVPLTTEWESSRGVIALLELARLVHDNIINTHQHDDGGLMSSSSISIGLPPVTAAFTAALLVVFLKPGGVALQDVSLSPYCVINRGEHWRLLSSCCVHLDAPHLITNLSALLPDAISLEQSSGGSALAADLLLLSLASSLGYVGFAVLQKRLLHQPSHYYSLVTIGASSLAFALKVWCGYKRGGVVWLWGVLPVPSQFSWVPSLALTHLCVPEASFPAHMAGVMAGLIRAYCVEPVVCAVKAAWQRQQDGSSNAVGVCWPSGDGSCYGPMQQQQQQQQQCQQQSFAAVRDRVSWGHEPYDPLGSCHDASQAAATATATASSRQQQQQEHSSNASTNGSLSLKLLDVGLQLCLAGAAIGLFVVCSRQTGRSSQRTLTSSFWKRF